MKMGENSQKQVEFPRERTGLQQVFPSPADGSAVLETPPALVWLPVEESEAKSIHYRCRIFDKDGKLIYSCETMSNTAVPDFILPPGEYRWDVEAIELGISRGMQTFSVPENAIAFLRPTAEEVIAGIPGERPRHLFFKEDTPEILKAHSEEIETLRRNIQKAYEDGMPERPMFHTDPNALPYREYFGRFRDFCDRNLVACALGYALLGDEEAGDFGKKLFLHICDWNPAGPCSLFGPWGDEVGLSCARCFPAVFDMLYPLLTEKERSYAGETIAAYATQCERRIEALHYISNPGNSHVGRLPAYLGEAALALWGENVLDESVLRRWISLALEIYGGDFPHFGGEDGSWAEGTFYSTSYTKWYLPFFSATARFCGRSFLNRPFYRNYARFLLHFALPDHENHPFGDGYWCTPESPEWPGFFAQNPFRTYASVSGLAEAEQYDRQLAAPELFSLHLLDVFLPKYIIDDGYKTAAVTDADAFPDGGYISLHSDHTDPGSDLHLMAHATKYASGSHRHPDQGSFALFFGGTALISPSGYFGRAYGTRHHMEWLNSTKAHNAILVDGVGQKYGDFRQTGKILACGEENGERTVVLDLTRAYPMLEKWQRTFRIKDQKTVVIEDVIKADHPVVVTYPLHMLSKPVPGGENVGCDNVSICRDGKTLLVLPAEGCFISCKLSDVYDVDLNEGEPEEYHVSMPEQYHVYYETDSKQEHHLCVEYKVL